MVEEVRHIVHTDRAQEEENCQLGKKVTGFKRLKDQKDKEKQQLHEQFYIFFSY